MNISGILTSRDCSNVSNEEGEKSAYTPARVTQKEREREMSAWKIKTECVRTKGRRERDRMIDRERQKECFSGTGVSGLASHNMSKHPAPPYIARRCGGSLNCAPSLMTAECLTLCSLRPSFPYRQRHGPPPPPRNGDQRMPSAATDHCRRQPKTAPGGLRAQRALSDLDSCDAFALLVRLVKVTSVVPKCTRVSCFLHRKRGSRNVGISWRG